jgi:hypothetical protein
MSYFSQLFVADTPYAYDLGEFGRYYRAHDVLRAHSRRVLPLGTILEVRYEELVSDFEQRARRIIAHCDLDWDPRLPFVLSDRTAGAGGQRHPGAPAGLPRLDDGGQPPSC